MNRTRIDTFCRENPCSLPGNNTRQGVVPTGIPLTTTVKPGGSEVIATLYSPFQPRLRWIAGVSAGVAAAEASARLSATVDLSAAGTSPAFFFGTVPHPATSNDRPRQTAGKNNGDGFKLLIVPCKCAICGEASLRANFSYFQSPRDTRPRPDFTDER